MNLTPIPVFITTGLQLHKHAVCILLAEYLLKKTNFCFTLAKPVLNEPDAINCLGMEPSKGHCAV
jgi:hypothetical protein